MINLCQSCNSIPNQNGYIKCSNDKCVEHNVDYFVWEWQALPEVTESLCENGSAACIESLRC